MGTAGTFEANMLAQWAYNELVSLETGFRSELVPVIPREESFTPLDQKISNILIQGHMETQRIKSLINELTPPDNVIDIVQPESVFFYDTQEGELINFDNFASFDNQQLIDCNVDLAVDIIDPMPIGSIVDLNLNDLIGTLRNDN